MNKVSEKSTKGEIWDAYNKLFTELQNRPVAVSDDPAKLQKMTAAMSEARAALMGQFEATIERLTGVQQAYQEADQELQQRKAKTAESLEQSKRELHDVIQTVRKQWEQEKADHELQRKREVESYDYELAHKRRENEEAYNQKVREREATLAEREAAASEREQATAALQDQVDSFPAQLEQAVKAARDETVKELKQQAATELKEARQALEHEKSILSLKLQSAESTNIGLSKQIVDLQRQLDASSQQLKEMAVAVIQAKNNPSAPAVQP